MFLRSSRALYSILYLFEKKSVIFVFLFDFLGSIFRFRSFFFFTIADLSVFKGGFIILQNEKGFPNRERPIIKVNLLQNDYHRSRTFIGIQFIKWQLKIHKNKTIKTKVFVNTTNFFCTKIFFPPIRHPSAL